MAKILADLSLRMSTDTVELNRGIDKLNTKLTGLKGAFGELGKKTEEVMGAIGGAIGGVVGEVTEIATSIMTAVGPIGLLVAAIGGIAMAWKEAQKGIQEYLKEEERAQYGKAGFNIDSKTARKETGQRARSGLQEGQLLVQEAERKLLLGINLTKVQKEELEQQKQMGLQMQANNLKLIASVGEEDGILGHMKQKLDWTQKYSGLLLQQELLEKKKISESTELTDLESELLEIKTKIVDKSTDTSEKQKLVKEYEEKANVIAYKKLDYVEKDLAIKTDLYKMTGRNEELELLILNTDKEKADINREYNKDIFQTTRLLNKVNAEQSKQLVTVEELLKKQKELNSHGSDGYKGIGYKGSDKAAPTDNLKYNAPAWTGPEGANQLREYTGLTYEQIAAINAENVVYEEQQATIEGLTSVFEDMFNNIGNGFKSVVTSMLDGIRRIIGGLFAKAIAGMISGESSKGLLGLAFAAAGITLITSMWKSKVPAFAEGTSFAPGGMSLVGERGPELVNIPRGSQIFNNGQTQSIFGSNIVVTGELVGRGDNLVAIITGQRRKINSFA